MSNIWLLISGLVFLFQPGSAPPATGNLFSPAEQAQLEKASNVEGRIKVYTAASKRIQHSLETAVGKDNFETVPDDLKLWTALLSKSLEDIEANLQTKKKSRALINYEIQVRKSISQTESFKIRAPIEQQDLFESCLSDAAKVRKKFVDILFRH
jgi:hypothetical protein